MDRYQVVPGVFITGQEIHHFQITKLMEVLKSTLLKRYDVVSLSFSGGVRGGGQWNPLRDENPAFAPPF